MNCFKSYSYLLVFVFTVAFFPTERICAQFDAELFQKKNLMAWCIVPFDAAKRSPEERAAMLEKLEIRRFAYDYREEHVPTFEKEILELKKHGIELTAWWFPMTLNQEAETALSLFQKHNVHPQLWVMGGGDLNMGKDDREKFTAAESNRIRTIAVAAEQVGCKVGLYNHGGWFGQPENQIELIKKIDLPNVGIVFNLHHAHDQLDRLPDVLKMLRPYLLAININGMKTDGERLGQKILPIGNGDRDEDVLLAISKSGYAGPIGILNHTDEDAEKRLRMNLDGLQKVVDRLSQENTKK